MQGKIYSVKVFVDDNKKPTLVLLNLGADYPNQLLTIAVYPNKNREKVMPDESFKGDIARVAGKIELYKGRSQIVARSDEHTGIVSSDAILVPKR